MTLAAAINVFYYLPAVSAVFDTTRTEQADGRAVWTAKCLYDGCYYPASFDESDPTNVTITW